MFDGCQETVRAPAKDKYTLKDAQERAASFGGECLSTGRVTADSKLRWRCQLGHEWDAAWRNINLKQAWCGRCSSGRGEGMARNALELMFNAEFAKCHPAWLRRPGARRGLELDGYNESLKIAFEYQGDHHYELNAAPARYTLSQIGDVNSKDVIKRWECWQRGISLIVIPWVKHVSNLERFLTQIEFAVLNAGLKIPRRWKSVRPRSLTDIWNPPPSSKPVPVDLLLIAESRGGSCLSTAYVNTDERLRWRCGDCGYEWEAVAYSIRAGSWCAKCATEARSAIKRYWITNGSKTTLHNASIPIPHGWVRGRGSIKRHHGASARC